MVGKLLKHEYIRTRTPVALFALIVLAICLAGWGLSFLSPTVATVPFAVGVALSVGFVFIVQIYLAVDFYTSSFGRRGYLTHTLPVRGTTLVLAKLGWALVVNVVAVVWTAALGVLNVATAARLGMATWDGFWSSLWGFLTQADWIFWLMAISIAGLVLATLVQYYFSVAVGSEAWINRSGALGPIVTFLIVYVVSQIASLVSFVLPPSYLPMTGELSWTLPIADLINDPDTVGLPLASLLINYAIAAVLLWRTVVSVNRKLELR